MAALSETQVLKNCEVKKLADVKKLKLIDSNLKYVEVLGQCEAMERADLGNNVIEDAKPLKKCKNLNWLNLKNNKLTVMGFVKNLGALSVLNLSYNQIRDMSPVAALINLQALVLNGNQISDVGGLESLSKLNTLVLSSNKISEVDVSVLPSLLKLQLSHNQLEDFPNVKSNTSLKQLLLNDNKIKTVPSEYLSMHSITIMDIGNNELKQFKDIKPLTEISRLDQLNLKGNPLCDNEKYIDKTLKMFFNVRIRDGKQVGRSKKQSDPSPDKKEEVTAHSQAKKRPASSNNADCTEENSSAHLNKKQKKTSKTKDIAALGSTDSHIHAESTQLSANMSKISRKFERGLQKESEDSLHQTKREDSFAARSAKSGKKSKKIDKESGVIAIKEIKSKKMKTNSNKDIFSGLETNIGQGSVSSW